MLTDIRKAGWLGCALAFLALCKIVIVPWFCVTSNVLKITRHQAAKSWVLVYVQDVQKGNVQRRTVVNS
jgi:hypothetical protein